MPSFSSACDFMMGLGKPQRRAKFELAGFIYYGNIRESVLNDKFALWAIQWGVRDNVRTFEKRVVDFLFAIGLIAFFASSYGWCTNTSKAFLLKGWVTLGLYIRFQGYIYRKHIYTVRWGMGNGSATTLPMEVFTRRNFIAEFIRFLFAKNDKFTFWATLWGS